MEEIVAARRRCERVIDRIKRLPSHTNINDSCRGTLIKSALSELNFLSRLSSVPHLPPLSSNIGHLEAVLHILEQPFINGVSRVCKPILCSSSSSRSVYVDVVCSLHKNPVWVLVSDRNPKYASWDGHRPHKGKGFKLRIEEVLCAARSSQMMKPSSVVLFFSYGITDFLFEKLRDKFGASDLGLEFSCFDCGFFEELEDEWMYLLARSFHKARVLEIKVDDKSNGILGFKCGVKETILQPAEVVLQEEHSQSNLDDAFGSIVSRIKPWSKIESDSEGNEDIINFTTTALIDLVSGISNGCSEKLLATPEIELRQKFKGNLEFVIGQVMSEIQNPMHVDLLGALSGKRGIVCETVLSEFKELVSLYAGPNETFRAVELLKRLRVVPDSPSERMTGLPTTRNLAMKNKIVFGTGDTWHAITLTANMSFVRAVSQTGMSLVTIEHRPRALVGD